jgi:hypothetical protein
MGSYNLLDVILSDPFDTLRINSGSEESPIA